nr:NUDIX domain-containing protein [Syntrophotalea carbinolica]
MGLRTNVSAKGYWFVPGGRVYKNERLEEVLIRISLAELSRSLTLADCRFLGMYEHFYAYNACSEEFSTHYVVAAFSLKVETLESLPDQQHSEYCWFSTAEICGDPNVHAHTKDYFLPSNGIR